MTPQDSSSLSLIPAAFRDAAAADQAAVKARADAFRRRVEKDLDCAEAVRAFRVLTDSLWAALPDQAQPLLGAVHTALLGACKALGGADRLAAWGQTDLERAYTNYRIRNQRTLSRTSFDWACELFDRASTGRLPEALLTQTWETVGLRDALRWLRIFVCGLSGEDAVLPGRPQEPLTPHAATGLEAGGNVSAVVCRRRPRRRRGPKRRSG
jgi:hypothetical protein